MTYNKEYFRKYYLKNYDKIKRYRKKRKKIIQAYNKTYNKSHRPLMLSLYKAFIKRNRQKVLAYLKSHPCVDCGESDPIVLEFDHVRGKKRDIISKLCGRYCWEELEKEISKCDVRCANCHKRRTAKKQKWFKSENK